MSKISIWRLFSPFRSATNAQNFLLHCYNKIEVKGAEVKSYDNCYPFIYYLEHGQNYYDLAAKAPLSIKPILLFYGMVQLLKACLLTVDPQYPESTSVLAHGVSTRKRKKQDYEFLLDEVKIQKNGLFPHFSERMFHVKHLEGNKYTMQQLFKRIPEMNQLFLFSHRKSSHYCVGAIGDKHFSIPNNILDDLKMTFSRFSDFVKQHTTVAISLEDTEPTIQCRIEEPFQPNHCEPFAYNYYNQTLNIPKNRDLFTHFPEVMTHYLLLYNLSMICRYETEWWSDLLHTYSTVDYPFIQNFVELTMEKTPYLLFLFLSQIHTDEVTL